MGKNKTQEKTEIKKQEEQKSSVKGSQRIAVVLVRGLVNIRTPVKTTLTMLRLTRKNQCIVMDNNPVNMGMLKKVKDYVAWGEISEDTFKELVEKRGEEYQGPETCSKGKIKYKKFFTFNNKKYKKYFRLNPPRKGFPRKGIKIPFKVGGSLGCWGEKINDLIKRML
jgi:large subunit ribosomal protein L30